VYRAQYRSHRSASIGRPTNQTAPLRLTQRHFPSHIPGVNKKKEYIEEDASCTRHTKRKH